MEQCVLTNDPSLKVDCHFFSPPSNNWDSQPIITPSPRSSSTLHDNSSGWRAPTISLNNNRFASSNEFDSDGKRLGYDGTTQTPSTHLLKPTASSLGHRVQKVVHSQVQLSSPGLFHSSRLDSPRIGVNVHDASDLNTPVFDGNRATGGHVVTKMTIDTSTLDPFGKLNHSNDATSDDDEDMANMTYNSSDLLLDFEFDVEPTEEEGINGSQFYHIPGSGRDSSTPPGSLHPPRPGFHRCSSWSPGSKTALSQRLRSHNIDPVASQLLRACVAQEEEQEWKQDPLSLSSHAIGRIPKAAGASSWDDAALCHSPIPPSDNGNFSFSASMPDLLSPIPSALKSDRGGSKDTPMIAEEAPIDYSLSPVPLFRDVSDSLLDVKTEDDIKCLPRPVPRKFSMPTIAASPSRRSYFPRRSYA